MRSMSSCDSTERIASGDLDEDCPICCETMSTGDVRYPLICPTVACRMNFCLNCIRHLQKAAADGYQTASDGSKQLKVYVKCPQCRSDYQLKNSKYPSSVVVDSVVLLRQAHHIVKVLQISDDQLSASDLHAKNDFLQSQSLEAIQTALDRLQVYARQVHEHQRQQLSTSTSTSSSIPNHDDDHRLTIPPLDWSKLHPYLPESREEVNHNHTTGTTHCGTSQLHHSTSNDSHESSNSSSFVSWKDPTLFYGWQDLLTMDEQEFLTHLYISGQEELLSQAALILQGIIWNSANARSTGPPTSNVISDLSFSSANTNNRTTTNTTTKSNKKLVADLYKLKQRYPLPPHMPLGATLPAFDPLTDRKPLLRFQKEQIEDVDAPLVIKSVKGKAGQVGLRKGDVVTHVNSERVYTFAEYCQLMQQAVNDNNNDTTTVAIVVNANADIAQQLRDRALKMKHDNIKIYQ